MKTLNFTASVVAAFLVATASLAETPAEAPEKTTDAAFDGMFSNTKTFDTADSREGWQNGWIAQSYFAPIGTDLPEPNGYPVDRWVDQGDGLFSTDYLYAFAGERSYLYNAGTLRTASIYVDKPGNYRFELYTDRYWSPGQPRCDVRFAVDGSTIIDAQNTFTQIDPAILKKGAIDIAQKYHEFAFTKSPVFEIIEPGFYRMDFYSYCRDVSDAASIYKLAFQYGNVQAKSFASMSMISKANLFYGGDTLVKDGVKLREDISVLKSAIAANHGTMFDLVIENVDSGRKARVTGDDIWHKDGSSPSKTILRPSMEPQSAIAEGGWVFRGVRGKKAHVWVQESYEAPVWGQAFMNMPFTPEYLEARKKLTFSESGVQGIAISYDPMGYSAALGHKMSNGGVFDVGGKVERAIQEESKLKPKSEYTQMFIEKKMPDGSIRRLKIFDGHLEGSMFIGEVKFVHVNLPAGDYELVVLRDPNAYAAQAGRYGDLTPQFVFKADSNFSLRIKEPSAESYRLIR